MRRGLGEFSPPPIFCKKCNILINKLQVKPSFMQFLAPSPTFLDTPFPHFSQGSALSWLGYGDILGVKLVPQFRGFVSIMNLSKKIFISLHKKLGNTFVFRYRASIRFEHIINTSVVSHRLLFTTASSLSVTIAIHQEVTVSLKSCLNRWKLILLSPTPN